MPTYDFRCPNGHQFERFFRKISDSPGTVECGDCGAMAERLVSGGAGLHFKGSGFYLTDYGRNAHRGGPAPSNGAEPGTASPGGDAKKGDTAGSASSGDGAAPAKKSSSSESSGASDRGGTPAKPKSGSE